MRDEYIREGATFQITIKDTDITAATATMTISNSNDEILEQPTATFSLIDGKAISTITLNTENLAIGEYDYMYTITYNDGYIMKLPDISGCNGGCKLPKFIVCNANDVE